MNFYTFNYIKSSNLLLFGLLFVSWLGLLAFQGSESVLLYQAGFALGASLVSLFVLRVVNYFNPLRIVPRKSDLILMFLAVTLGAVGQKLVFNILFESSFGSVHGVFLWALPVSAVVFSAHYLYCLMVLKVYPTRKIALDLTEQERTSIIRAFADNGMHSCVRFLNRRELEWHTKHGREKEIKLIIISRKAVNRFDVDGVLIRAHLAGIPIVDYFKALVDLTGKVNLEEVDLWSYVLLATPQTSLLKAASFVKNITEPVVAAVLGILLSPLILCLAVAVKLTSKGPVFYRQVRTGYMGREFTLFKFRSMKCNAEENGPQWSSCNDSRTTTFGRFLRRTRLDELPQLWNVINGDMSFFGPRPERPEMCRRLAKDIPLFRMRTHVRPGITGWAQVCSGYAASVEESKEKLEYDLYYIQRISPRLDLIILIKTLKVMIFGTSGRDVASEALPGKVAPRYLKAANN